MKTEADYLHILRNRIMALRAKLENCPNAGDITFSYGQDYYQEEVRSIGLRMIRDGLYQEGEKLMLDYTREHYPDQEENEVLWISKMMRYLHSITDDLIDNLKAEGYTVLQSNTDLPYENALFFPVQHHGPRSYFQKGTEIRTQLPLDMQVERKKPEGLLYFRSNSLAY